MYGKTSIWEDIKNEFYRGNIITRLIFINIVVWVVMHLGIFIFNKIVNDPALMAIWSSIFTLPADLGKLVRRPWTLLTHMFAHSGLFHILFNMLWLYWMGRILKEYLGGRKILPIYIYGALTGAVVYILSYNLFSGFAEELPYAEALGASAAVMAIILATATLLPDYSIHLILIGPVKLKWIALVAVIIDLAVGLNSSNAGGSLAHLGGAFFGFIFIKQLQRGNDLSAGFNRLQDSIIDMFSSKKGPRVSYKNPESRSQRPSSRRKPEMDMDKQERIDSILDKIAKSGYDSLNKDEKEFLFRVSKDE